MLNYIRHAEMIDLIHCKKKLPIIYDINLQKLYYSRLTMKV